MQRRVIVTPELEAHFISRAGSIFQHVACIPSRDVVPSHDAGVEIILELLEDKDGQTAYQTICREKDKTVVDSYISLCRMIGGSPVIVEQFDNKAQYQRYFASSER